MNKTKVKLPFSDMEIEQLEGSHAVTEAADLLQKTIIENTNAKAVKGLELGSGNGIISLMLALQRPDWQLTGIELQKDLCELSVSNAALLGDHCQFISGDIREHRTLLKHWGYQLIYANPPWVKSGSGLVSPDKSRAISRQEVTCTMRDVLQCINWCLEDEGFAWIIYPLDRKAELAKEVLRTELEVVSLIQSDQSPKSFIAKIRRKPLSEQW
ncbi:MAG: methyltransferase [Candidatus Cloacimonetes bacterium]|nr:methyltransferase [Candidatus Cloacimonadota bacterium]